MYQGYYIIIVSLMYITTLFIKVNHEQQFRQEEFKMKKALKSIVSVPREHQFFLNLSL